MNAIEEVRAQAREALEQQTRALLEGYGMSAIAVNLRDALRALLDATEPSTVAVKTEFRVLDAPKDCDYHEGFEEGIKVGRAGSGPRPITDEMLGIMAQAFFEATGTPGSGIRYTRMTVKPEIVAGLRAALEAAEEARR